MSNDKTALAVIPRTIQEAREMAGQYAKSSLMPADLRGKEADIFTTVMAGLELGMAPMAALRSIYVVKGRPILSADAMVGLVKASGLCDYFVQVEATNTAATYETKRKGDPRPQAFTFTMADAQLAGLGGGDNWRKYPRQMLMARAKAALARDVYSDVLSGVYEEHERDEIEGRVQGAAVIEAEVVEADADDPAIADLESRIIGARALGELSAIVDALRAMPESAGKVRLRQAYKAAQIRLVRDYPAAGGGDGATTDRTPADGHQLQLVGDAVVDNAGDSA